MNNNAIFPTDFEVRMKSMLKEEYDSFLETFIKEEPYLAIRVNTLKSNSTDKIKEECGYLEKVLWCDNGYYIDKTKLSGKHPYHVGGLIYFQEPSAMSVVEALNIKQNDYVLDLCAAPGGKATAAAEKLKGTGLLIANEIIPKRAKILAENITRLGIKNAIVTNENPPNLSNKFPSFFDKIIVDAPCSGEGMFKKEPQAIEQWSVEHTVSCCERQKKILKDAISMLKADGNLIYSTCTYAPVENEGVVDWVLNNFPEMELVPISLNGLSDANGDWVNSSFDLSFAKRIFPHKAKGEGHFLALFKKNDGKICNLVKEYKNDKQELYRKFERENLNVKLDGQFVNFGDKLFLMPKNIDLAKIKVELAGLFLGVSKKGRFEPSHALCLALDKSDFKNTIEVDECRGFFGGETLECQNNGWTAVIYNDYPIGWGKASDGILKNHFPKHLRF